MPIEKGTLVRIKRNGAEGIVERIPGKLMVRVRLKSNGTVITVAPEELVELGKATSQPALPNRQDSERNREKMEQKKELLAKKTIGLGLEPVYSTEGIMAYFNVFLFNESPYDITFEMEAGFRKSSSFTNHEGLLKPGESRKTGTLQFDELNDLPYFFAACRIITTEGESSVMEKELSIKPRMVLSSPKVHLATGTALYYFEFFKAEPMKTVADAENDLKQYTLQKVPKPRVPGQHTSEKKQFSINDPKALAAFPRDIDLHIEELDAASGKRSNGEILGIQLAAFEEYLENALKLGVDKVFIIHGVGEGKLRNAVHERLKAHPHVKTFVNEYHSLYGYGATEVFLG